MAYACGPAACDLLLDCDDCAENFTVAAAAPFPFFGTVYDNIQVNPLSVHNMAAIVLF